ncbi:MAG: phosphoribosylamine--glycine ligase [Ferrovum sp. 37-45-19]|uniref:phosphoribosylamine--glycine ligase n=1 Tax=Ferrovum sp. JA12 TaxID=1356299 RepID=UPI00070396B5|nr:phosphoribosylamine--glycine ligase [Ferrovum sp. JA12]OYV80458.1 MAG: phosphoribosylamine--glycine ligase [Ferrovum sp. 21-44-67]OYV94773.1 MAG: phosphoribosylamine--glycine ligase [Ferrovum sp. 37-45-19]OZB31913.1 MAG: phosphoribosylamine--glycine ligase [Ferrovum sp. 34-44-207]HQT81107.1 phosphoribosylamine--glycine ligase [Ferrovaceae bacterium]KRH79167.1 phosphoribosylamine--glycine ligase [Ferrovum sp. JA12]
MKILVIGSGGREHALAWRLVQSEKVSRVYVAPGNAGTAQEEGLYNVNLHSVSEWLRFAQEEPIDLTVVGPEAPLSEGVVDAFRAAGLAIFGPTQLASQLEASKDFAKAFMLRHHIPTAAYATFSEATLAHQYIEERGAPIVIKADGLAAGKGVVVAMTLAEAHEAVEHMFAGSLGAAGHRVVIEEFLQGEEASFIVLSDGENVCPLATSQDHKRLQDGDEGPNTGGMGAYSPAPVVTPDIHAKAMRQVIMPAIRGMKAEGRTYTGFLYAGLMISPAGEIKTLEFNCRMGDPETQPIMMRLKSDLVEVLELAVKGRLDQVQLEWDRRSAVGVVMAAHNYPNTPRVGDVITDQGETTLDTHVFHGGTGVNDQGQWVTRGGRVLCVTALGDTLRLAASKAYQRLERLEFAGQQYRRDIGWRALKSAS